MRGILRFAGTILLTSGFATLAVTPADAASLEFTVSEDASPGTPIGSVTDDADASISPPNAAYGIAHDGHGVPFLIDPHSGAISLASMPLDFERQARHEFTVRIRKPRALDAARRAYLSDLLISGADPATLDGLLFEVSERSIAVNVSDAAEPPVLTSDPLTIVVRESGENASAQVTVHDPDADDSHVFELVAGDQQQFQIDPQSGVLTFLAGSGDGGTFPVTVHVTDDDGLSDAVTFNIEVIVPPAPVTLAAQTPAEVEVVAPVVEVVAPVEVSPTTATPNSATDVAPQAALPEPVPDGSDSTAHQVPAAAGALPGDLVEPPLADVEVPADLSDDVLMIADGSAARSPTEQAVVLESFPAVAAPLAANTSAIAAAELDTVPAAAGNRVRAVSLRTLLALAFLLLAAGVGAIAVLLRRLRRTIPVEESQPSAFRVVREARMITAATGGGQRTPATDEAAPTAPAADPGRLDADKAAVHELIASAFQQAATPVPQPSARVDDPDSEPIPTRIVMPSSPLPPPLPPEAMALDLEPEHEVVYVDEVIAAPAADVVSDQLHETVDTSDDHWRADPANDIAEPEPQSDTEPFSLPYAQFDSAPVEMTPSADEVEMTPSAGDQMGTIDFSGLHALESSNYTAAETSGYDAPLDDDLGGGYYGLRLSQSVVPPADEDISPSEVMPYSEADEDSAGTSGTVEFRAADSKPAAEDDDPKVKELRRQLSDLFGVSADRPRPAPAPAVEAELNPARTVDFDHELLAQEDLSDASQEQPFEPVAQAQPSAAPPAAEPTAVPESDSDPVSSWLAYLKQRTLDQSATPSRPATVPSTPPAPVAAIPAASMPSPAPYPLEIPQRKAPTAPASVMRVDKTAVREEITLLRDLANRHSRNVLAQRASHQRARFAWVLWGTSLVVLCFTGLTAVQHNSHLIRMVGWLLFACAAVALAGCIHGFRGLTSRGERAPDEAEGNDAATAEDFDRTTAPDLMTPEMEERLRSVMEDIPAVPVGGAMESES